MGIQDFCVLMLQLFLIFHTKTIDSAQVSDTMLAGEALTGSQTIISNNGIFQLGFFNLQNTGKWYVGIWYAQAMEEGIAWVANNENPLQNASAIFNLTENGSLVISYRGSVIWSTQGGTQPSSAVITDSGNLVVTSARNKSEIIWQSFDTPGSIWLPGMKISATTKLISWKSPRDPSPGLFSFQLDPSGILQEVLMWNNSVTYWESGPWNGRVFSNVPAMTEDRIHIYSFGNNGTQKYITYVANLKHNALAGFLTMLDTWGKVRVSILQGNPAKWSMFWSVPGKSCDVYGVCGAYGSCNPDNVQSCNCVQGFRPRDIRAWEFQDWSGGCVRQTPLDCQGDSRNYTTDGFVELSGKSMPRGAVPYMLQSMSIQQCDQTCLSNCSCTAYAYSTDSTYPICQLWFGDLYNLNDDTSTSMPVFVRVAAADVPKSSSTTNKTSPVSRVPALVAISAAILVIALLLFIWYRRLRLPVNSADSAYLGSLKVFSYKELQIATKKFSERLGRGGFGSVFKGTLPDKTLVAVKKLENLSHAHGEKQFRMEVSTIGTIQHVNLVRLRGFCSVGSNRMLVYDFMPNGSLNTLLFPKRQDGDRYLKVLDWKTRFGIVLGTARALLYLHEECRDCIIHCDVKPENILLDSDLCPKLADFGMAKFMGREFSRVLTTMRGTRGYLAPEWISGLPITAKADVYSFGMTVLEILSGRRNADVDPEDSDFFFPSWAAAEMKKGNFMGVVEEDLKCEVDVEEAKRVVMVAGWCIQDEEEARPSMREVVQILQGLGEVRGVPPIPRSLQALV